MPENRIFAIGDLHLPGGNDKTMDVFGKQWLEHFARISEDWASRVQARDIVLIPGDISWAMSLAEAKPDLNAISALPGIKVMIKGNHDFWWSSISQVRALLGADTYALQNDAVRIEGRLIAGSRGWLHPSLQTQPEDYKIYQRELMRLEMSLQKARALGADLPLYVMAHFPPLGDDGAPTKVSDLLEKYGVSQVVYGHIHGTATLHSFNGIARQIRYDLVSCDALGFQLLQLP